MFPEWAKQRWWWSRHQEHPRLLLPDLQPGDELREHVSDGRHPGKRGNLSNHRGESSRQRSCQECAQPHVQLWHVQLLRTVCVPGWFARQVWSVWHRPGRCSQRGWFRHLVAPSRQYWQLGQGSHVCGGARQDLQLPHIRLDWRAHKRQEEPESAKLRGTKSEACPTLVCCVPGRQDGTRTSLSGWRRHEHGRLRRKDCPSSCLC